MKIISPLLVHPSPQNVEPDRKIQGVIIRGNKKPEDNISGSEAEALRSATALQKLLRAEFEVAMQDLEVFLFSDGYARSGPPELPGTTNLMIEAFQIANFMSQRRLECILNV